MEHSKHFEKVKYYYEEGFWNIRMVYNVVAKGWITPDEYEEITGEKYKPPVTQEPSENDGE